MQHGYRLEATEVSKNIEVEDNNFPVVVTINVSRRYFFQNSTLSVSINLSFSWSFSYKAWHNLPFLGCEFFWSKKKPPYFFPVYLISSYEKRQNLGIFRVLFFLPPTPVSLLWFCETRSTTPKFLAEDRIIIRSACLWRDELSRWSQRRKGLFFSPRGHSF